MAHPLMIEQLLKLIVAVRNVAENDPLAVASNPNTKLLVALSQLIFEEIPADPQNRKFLQGETLGKEHKHWFRAKFGNGRFRLFFRFSTTHRTLIFSWVNDEQSLRTYGSRTDAYKVFRVCWTVFRRAKLTPMAGQSASNFDPPQVLFDHALLGSGWSGS